MFYSCEWKKSWREPLQLGLNLFLLLKLGKVSKVTRQINIPVRPVPRTTCIHVFLNFSPAVYDKNIARQKKKTQLLLMCLQTDVEGAALCFVSARRGRAEEAARRDQRGFSATGAGPRTEQEAGTGAEDERGGQVQVRGVCTCRRVRQEVQLNIAVCFDWLWLSENVQSAFLESWEVQHLCWWRTWWQWWWWHGVMMTLVG